MIAFLLALLLASILPGEQIRPVTRFSRTELREIARPIASRYGLNLRRFVAVAMAESRGVNTVRRDGSGRCDVGPWQVRVDCSDSRRILIDPALGALTAAKIARASANRCARDPLPQCLRCDWALYNSGSLTWCDSVERWVER